MRKTKIKVSLKKTVETTSAIFYSMELTIQCTKRQHTFRNRISQNQIVYQHLSCFRKWLPLFKKEALFNKTHPTQVLYSRVFKYRVKEIKEILIARKKIKRFLKTYKIMIWGKVLCSILSLNLLSIIHTWKEIL
jgi:hypothetical protein